MKVYISQPGAPINGLVEEMQISTLEELVALTRGKPARICAEWSNVDYGHVLFVSLDLPPPPSEHPNLEHVYEKANAELSQQIRDLQERLYQQAKPAAP